MTRLVRAELFKLGTTRFYFGMLASAVGVVVLVTVTQLILGDNSSLTIEGASSVIETEADLRSILNVSGVAALFTLVLGATAMAGEHRHRTIASTFLLTPKRGEVVVAKLVGYTLAGTIFGIVVEAAALVVVAVWLTASGMAIPFGGSVAAGLVLTPVATGLAAGFGVGIGAAVPNQLGAVLIAIGWVMVAEQLIAGLLPSLANWLPFRGANTAIIGQHPNLGVAAGFGLFLAYVGVVSAVGASITSRRDVA